MESNTLYAINLDHHISTAFGSTLFKEPLFKIRESLFSMSVGICTKDFNKREKLYLASHTTKEKIASIVKASDKAFKDFVLSPSRYEEYDSCRALKKVPKIPMLIKKFEEDEQFETIKQSTKLLLNHIDDKAHVYYAIASNLEGSVMEQLPQELVGHIFHYADGDINF